MPPLKRQQWPGIQQRSIIALVWGPGSWNHHLGSFNHLDHFVKQHSIFQYYLADEMSRFRFGSRNSPSSWGGWGEFVWGCFGGRNPSTKLTYPTEREKENHRLKSEFCMGYVNSQEGIYIYTIQLYRDYNQPFGFFLWLRWDGIFTDGSLQNPIQWDESIGRVGIWVGWMSLDWKGLFREFMMQKIGWECVKDDEILIVVFRLMCVFFEWNIWTEEIFGKQKALQGSTVSTTVSTCFFSGPLLLCHASGHGSCSLLLVEPFRQDLRMMDDLRPWTSGSIFFGVAKSRMLV